MPRYFQSSSFPFSSSGLDLEWLLPPVLERRQALGRIGVSPVQGCAGRSVLSTVGKFWLVKCERSMRGVNRRDAYSTLGLATFNVSWRNTARNRAGVR